MNQRISRRIIDDYAEDDSPSRGFMGMIGLLLLHPRQFFRQMESVSSKHTLLVTFIILVLLSFSAIRQTPVAMESLAMGEEMSDSTEFSSVAQSDPSQSWMTGLTAAGIQVVYWLGLAVILSEVSLFNGKAPQFGRNVRIAVWASLPLAVMAAVQMLFLTGGGSIGAAGFTGFLDEWQGYSEMNSYLQLAVRAVASQINLFSFWSAFLLYSGARDGLKGKRLPVGLALAMWLSILVLGMSFQEYQKLNPALSADENYADYQFEGEAFPVEEMPSEETEPVMNTEEF
jgi:hypothetical protein